MNLFILRHGKAENFARSDVERALKSRGEGQVHQIADSYLQGIAIDSVLISPYRRAQQTADIACQYLKQPYTTSSCQLIEPESNVQAFCDFVCQLNPENLLIVSHQTFVGRLIDYLADNSLGYGMGTANLAALELITPAKKCGELLWIKVPEK
jgi:phosphohistidine phosphatase